MIVIKTNDGRRIRCDEDDIKPGWASPFEVWGRKWDERKERWTAKNLYYVSDYEVEA